jgi:hypothetical protein
MECIPSADGNKLDIVCEDYKEIAVMFIAITSFCEGLEEVMEEPDLQGQTLSPLLVEARKIAHTINDTLLKTKFFDIENALKIGDILT